MKGLHFKCNYCKKAFVGPSNSSLTSHLTKERSRFDSIFLQTSLGWEQDWMATVEEHFVSWFNYYKTKLGGSIRLIIQPQRALEPAENVGETISNFLKRKRQTVSNQTEEEFQRYRRF